MFVSMVEESSSRRSNKIIQITNDTTSAWGVALIPVGSCTWRCFTRVMRSLASQDI